MRAVLLAVALVACTKSDGNKPADKPAEPVAKPSDPGAKQGAKPGPDKPEKHEMNLPAVLDKFHAALAPRWHAPKGDQRMTDTCAAVAELQADADEVAKTPSGDTATWGEAAKTLVAAVATLKEKCDAKDAAAFETAFGKVHDGFHGMLPAAGVNHEEHEHEDHKM